LIDGDVGQGFVNSLKMASGTAVFGTLLVFVTAYLLEKTKGMNLVRAPLHMLAVIPMAVPGLVLGLGYIFFFNMPSNPLHGMYQSMTLLTLAPLFTFTPQGI
jgi:iron(III) transport system permease protein